MPFSTLYKSNCVASKCHVNLFCENDEDHAKAGQGERAEDY